MRLYVNTKEVMFLKGAPRNEIKNAKQPVQHDRLCDILERVELCEALQKSERRAKKEEINND